MNKRPSPKPLSRTLEPAQVARHRNLDCPHYDGCLDTAEEWPGFTCRHCPLFTLAAPRAEPPRMSPLACEDLEFPPVYREPISARPRPLPAPPKQAELARIIASGSAPESAEAATPAAPAEAAAAALAAALMAQALQSPAVLEHLEEKLAGRTALLRRERRRLERARQADVLVGLPSIARVAHVSVRTLQRAMGGPNPPPVLRGDNGRYAASAATLRNWRRRYVERGNAAKR